MRSESLCLGWVILVKNVPPEKHLPKIIIHVYVLDITVFQKSRISGIVPVKL